MYSKGIAIVAITRNGVETALKIRDTLTKLNLSSNVYAPKKYAQAGVAHFDQKLEDFIENTYHNISAIVAVMATGIIIRAVSPHLEDKLVDPAVISVDASGKFVISMLSGYYGGANELATIIAEGIGATPVITTASDILGKQSVEDLAKGLHLSIANPESVAAVNAAIANSDRVALVHIGDMNISSEQVIGYEIKKAETAEQALAIVNSYDAGAIVTKEALPVARFVKPVTILKLQQFSIGLAAKSDVTTDHILRAVTSTLKTAKVPIENVANIASVGVMQDLQSMINASLTLGFNLKLISTDALKEFKHPDLTSISKDEKEDEINEISERAALIAAGPNAHLILKKTRQYGVTVAIASN
jgi:cobalt-precorrin 5A hydrolase